uniref:WGS project CBMI000000000 data, contig CS3069_c001745 n=1 Tax=Fusarium clavum TaxID=2594811 RepID=A0A090MBY0_9HYPO|nr:unnamed protein product [Fusarium clavum]
MPSLPPFQAVLFYSAALAHVAIVPKHIYVGATVITEAIATIPSLLNYKWAKYGSPTLMEEKMIVGLAMGAGFYAGWPYWKLKMYSPLVMLWLAPIASTIATILG